MFSLGDTSGYDYKLEYNPTATNNINENNKSKNNRKRNITWFNLQYSKNVASNIGKQFLNLEQYSSIGRTSPL